MNALPPRFPSASTYLHYETMRWQIRRVARAPKPRWESVHIMLLHRDVKVVLAWLRLLVDQWQTSQVKKNRAGRAVILHLVEADLGLGQRQGQLRWRRPERL